MPFLPSKLQNFLKLILRFLAWPKIIFKLNAKLSYQKFLIEKNRYQSIHTLFCVMISIQQTLNLILFYYFFNSCEKNHTFIAFSLKVPKTVVKPLLMKPEYTHII